MRTVLLRFVLLLVVFLFSACSVPSDKGGTVALEPVTRIAVLPVTASVSDDPSLVRGADTATGIMTDELGGHPKVMLLTRNQVATATPEVSGGLAGAISAIGRKYDCDAVLVTEIHAFKQREGTELAADAPASAAFSMVLYHTGKKTVLWSADFQETQEAFLDNILSYEKVQKRGLKWITVEELLSQGIKERLGECQYLAL